MGVPRDVGPRVRIWPQYVLGAGSGVGWGYYHMYVSYIRGVPQTWAGHERHFSITLAQTWCNGWQGQLCLSSNYVIDACVFERPDGGYRMWYRDEADRPSTWVVESEDLSRWDGARCAVSTPGGHEGPNVFEFCGAYWMVVDCGTAKRRLGPGPTEMGECGDDLASLGRGTTGRRSRCRARAPCRRGGGRRSGLHLYSRIPGASQWCVGLGPPAFCNSGR